MRSSIICMLVFLWTYTPAASNSVQTLTTCENLSGWPSSGQLAPDAPQGNFAITTPMPTGQTGFFSYDFRSTGLDISGKYSLGFWWKVDGSGLQDLKIKIRNYPLVGGMEAVYTIWSGQTSPEGWQLAVVELSKPQFDDWGGEPNLERRYITFRTVTSSTANVRLSIDHIVAVDQTFSWQVNSPQLQTGSIDHLDFDHDGSIAFGDFILFVQKFGTTQTDSAYDASFDLDSDGTVGFSDFLVFAAGFGSDGTQRKPPGRHGHPTSESHATDRPRQALDIAVYVQLSAAQHQRSNTDRHHRKCRA